MTPHSHLSHFLTPSPRSWQNWDPATWEDIWSYRHHFALPPEFRGLRVFLHFDKVLASAQPVLNGDQSWQDIAVQNVHDMVLRNRNHPSIVI
jgi:beta-galactosidase/beta-glucuronidase